MNRDRSAEPCLVGTWSFALPAMVSAWNRLGADESSLLDVIEETCAHADLSPAVDSVGIGGLPDATGSMSLDGAIMCSPRRFAGVCGLRKHAHPVSVARKVMECTEHTLLCGEDADRFADRYGLARSNLLSSEARAIWEAWVDQQHSSDMDDRRHLRPVDSGDTSDGRLFRPGRPEGAARAGHDTIGVLGRDGEGRMAAGCSTSGLPFKVPGRVGDSPIAGHGLYVAPGVGQATATGTGEMISGVCASHLAIEVLRRGGSVLDAAAETVQRVDEAYELEPHHQVAVIVMDAEGRISSAALRPGFRLAILDPTRSEVVDPDVVLLGDRDDDDGRVR